eukprot:s705_g20.t1
MGDLKLEEPPANGGIWTGLVEVTMYDNQQQCHGIKSALRGIPMTFRGQLPPGQTVLLVVKAITQHEDDQWVLIPGPHSHVIPRPTMNVAGLSQVVELCSGMGCLGVGLSSAGFDIKLRSDCNPNMLKLAKVIGNEPTLLGNLHDDEVLAQVCLQAPEAGLLTSGIACQPYSRLGDEKCEADQRAATLPGTLRIGFLGRFAIIVLECVEKAKDCTWLQTTLRRFAEITGYHISQGELKLQDVWPSRRHRWWAVLTHQSVGFIHWHPFPRIQPKPLVAHVLDCFKTCNDFELKNLMLDLYELGRFGAVGFDTNEIPWNGQMATALHSCGNQLSSCPCGCRKFPFTDERLAKGGLHGLLVRLAGHAKCGTTLYPSYRHVHPDELALLCGMFPGFQWDDPKMALCALGQLASPMQSIWIGAFIKQHVHKKFNLPQAEAPTLVLLRFMEQLLQARDQVFGLPSKHSTKAFQTMIEQRTFVMPATINVTNREDGTPAHDGHMPLPAPARAPEVTETTEANDDQATVRTHASVPGPLPGSLQVASEHPVGQIPALDNLHPTKTEMTLCNQSTVLSRSQSVSHANPDMPQSATTGGTMPADHAGPDAGFYILRAPGIPATPGEHNAEGTDKNSREIKQGNSWYPLPCSVGGKDSAVSHTSRTDHASVHVGPVLITDASRKSTVTDGQLHKGISHDIQSNSAHQILHYPLNGPEASPAQIENCLQAGPQAVRLALRTPGITATPGDKNAGTRTERDTDHFQKDHLGQAAPKEKPFPGQNTVESFATHVDVQAGHGELHPKETNNGPVQFGEATFAVATPFAPSKSEVKHWPDNKQSDSHKNASVLTNCPDGVFAAGAIATESCHFLSGPSTWNQKAPHPYPHAGPETEHFALRTPGITATPGDQNAGMMTTDQKPLVHHVHGDSYDQKPINEKDPPQHAFLMTEESMTIHEDRKRKISPELDDTGGVWGFEANTRSKKPRSEQFQAAVQKLPHPPTFTAGAKFVQRHEHQQPGLPSSLPHAPVGHDLLGSLESTSLIFKHDPTAEPNSPVASAQSFAASFLDHSSEDQKHIERVNSLTTHPSKMTGEHDVSPVNDIHVVPGQASLVDSRNVAHQEPVQEGKVHPCLPHAGPEVPPALGTPGITATPGEHNAEMEGPNEQSQWTDQRSFANPQDSQASKSPAQPDLCKPMPEGSEPSHPEDTNQVKGDEPEQTTSSPITVWVLHPDAKLPVAVETSSATTPAQLLQAEMTIGKCPVHLFLRSWVNTHLDLNAPLRDHQLIQVSLHLPAEKCRFMLAENSPPELHFPCDRREALWRQQAWVAVDEMDFYLDIIAKQQLADSMPTTHFFSQATASEEASLWLRDMIFYLEDANTSLSACIIGQHWIPVLIRREGTIIHFHTTPEGTPLLQCAQDIANWQNMTLRAIQQPLPQAFAADCGFQSFAWLFATALNLPIEAFTPAQAEGWRMIFAAHLLKQDSHEDTIHHLVLGGAGPDKQLFDQVAALLKEHGVWQDRVQERTTMVMSKINHNTLRSVITSPKSWAELKAAANHVSPVLKLIMPDELQAQIDARAGKRHKYGTKPQQTTFRKPDKTAEMPTVLAADLQVPHGVFVQQDGQLLGPLRPEDIGPSAKGIVLLDQQDTNALQKMQKPVTQQGLALVVIATKHNTDQHHVTPLRFPAICVPTQEPIIVSGYLYQLGAQQVRRFEPEEKVAVEQISTEVVRCLVFRDQSGALWDEMQKQPVKAVFSQEPQLQHTTDRRSPVIDVWDRQWLTKRFEKSKPGTADLFAFTFRMATDSLDQLLSASGGGGVYYEPRSHCGRKPNDTYHVTWLPNLSFQEAKYAQQTAPHVTSLTRHGDRYGLRSDAVNAEPIHAKFRPETPLLLGAKAMYIIGPLPFSTTKEGVAKLLRTWNWDARPLQPRGRSPDANGIQWTIQAVEDPAFWIYNLQHGDVLITKQQPTKAEPPTGQFAVIASKKTLDHLGQQDPWLQQDPWQKPTSVKPTSSHLPAAQPSITTAQLASMEANLERKLLSSLQSKSVEQDASMEPSALEERVSQLEQQLGQVQVSPKRYRESGPVAIGNMNPTGLRSKAKDLHTLPAGVYTVQETHLTAQAIPEFRKELKWQKTGYSLTHGHPAPPRSQSLSSIGGRHTGVAVLSKFPCRQIQHHWSSDEFSTGRCLTAAAFIQEHWLTIGTVYGYNEHRQSLETQQSTDSLLSKMTSRILHGSKGMRIMTGDWNLDRSQIPQADEWEAQGWVEAQQLAKQKWHRPVQSTCKKTSVKDFMYLSPEVIPYVTEVELNWTMFADHAVVIVHLADFNSPPKLPLWRKPSKLGWPKAPDAMEWDQRVLQHDNMDVWYERIWKNAEAYATHLYQCANQPLSANMLGRATTKEVHWTKVQSTPVKPNRRGDVQSSLDTSCLQHTRWTKQIRRLQHFTRCLLSQSVEVTLIEHRASLWHKIRTAPGFPGGFVQWWASQVKQFAESPIALPSNLPTSDQAQAIYTEFLAHYRQLEANLSLAKIDHAIQRRAADPNLIYRDVQREPAEPVQTLVIQQQLEVLQCVPSEGAVQVQCSQQIPEGYDVVRLNDVAMQAELTAADTFQVNTDHVDESARLTIERLEGDPVKIIQSFSAEWAPRWNKPAHDQLEVWDTITAFMQAAVPSRPAEFPPITIEMFRKEVKRKKWTAAVGPDGVSKSDLTNVPDAVVADLVAMLEAIENGQPWPSQAIIGVVTALAKVKGARTTNQYRPITIFSLYYRIWGSIRAKQCLRFLASIVPHTQLGNLPQRSSKQMWYHLQEVVEFSHAMDLESAGCVIDITKCFNALPRHPLLAIGAHLGLPDCVITPWTTALNMFQRRFQVRGYTGPAIPSNCGFPEGDALSTVAMAICCMACELWVVHKNPRIQVWSYVDNIETLTASAEDACESKTLLTQFCQLLDLEVDASKSYCWSTTARGRRVIRDSDTDAKLYARDLGGHMSYARLRTNKTVTQKIEDLQPFWHRAARSCAPNSHKQRAILTAAWPNLFYGICTVTIGACHFDKLRTLTTKALGFTQAGVAPMLQLACLSPSKLDPEFYCLVHTIRSYRDCHTSDLTLHTLESTLEGHVVSQGPCASLLHCLHKIAWSWEVGEYCLDQNRDVVSLLTEPMSLLEDRLQDAWQQRNMSHMASLRTTMEGAEHADVQLTRECFVSLPNDHQGLMRCALNGTQYTNNALAHEIVVTDATCKFCDHRDSQTHRHWHCEFFADIRKQYPELQELHTTADPCLLNHGWLPQSSHWLFHRRNLDAVLDTTDEVFPCRVEEFVMYHDLFLDGSCMRPHDKYLRVASWAVVLWTGHEFTPLLQGVVPGRRQTSMRGELLAAIAAVKFAARSQRPCRLWVDNKNVVDGLRALLANPDTDFSKKKDADLWRFLAQQLRVAGPLVVQVFKVQAHADADKQDSPLDTWAVRGNQAADKAAEAARNHLTSSFWTRWDNLRQDLERWRRLGRQIHAMYVAIAVKAQQAKTMPETQVVHPVGMPHEPEPTADPALLQLTRLSVDEFPSKYQVQAAAHVLQWIQHICQPDKPAIWVRHVKVCLSPDDLLQIDTFLQKHVERLPARQIKRDMAKVPPGWTN